MDVSVAGRLAPGVVGIGDVPFLAELVNEVWREGHRLRRRVVERPKTVLVALRGGQRGVETDADDVDDFEFLEHRHAGEADIGEKTPDMHVDFVLDQ